VEGAVSNPVSRLLRMSDAGLSGLGTGQVVSNIRGLSVGSIETTLQAIVNATEQILLRPDVTVKAIGIGLAVSESGVITAPDEFRVNPGKSNLHTSVPEGVRLLADGARRIDVPGRPFAEPFILEYGVDAHG
jgi:hypothetical protein